MRVLILKGIGRLLVKNDIIVQRFVAQLGNKLLKSRYEEIVRHIPSLEDHGNLYMYYGTPHSEYCFVYGEDDDGEGLIVSYIWLKA